MTKDLLLIFVKKPEAGKVKTRLAATIGDQKALEIYQQLLQHTHNITAPLGCNKIVYYAPDIQEADLWSEGGFRKAQQAAGNLGEKMTSAFQDGFLAGYQQICIIGSDCYQLTTAMIEEAFALLRQNDVVIGPSRDGGYYLLGMKQLHKMLFQNKQWSTSSVCHSTISDIKKAGLCYTMLPQLIDIDTSEDLKSMQ